MEGDFATNGIGALAARWACPWRTRSAAWATPDGDGREEFARGRPVRVTAPAVALDPASRQAAIEGDTSQDVVTLFFVRRHRGAGARARSRRERPPSELQPAGRPRRGRRPVDAPPDGRVLDPARGGWLHELIVDAEDGAQRNNGNGTPPRAAVVRWDSNARGLPTSLVDPRGVRHTIVWNALDQVVELRAASATAASGGPHGDPATGRGDATLAPLGDATRFVYDAATTSRRCTRRTSAARPGRPLDRHELHPRPARPDLKQLAREVADDAFWPPMDWLVPHVSLPIASAHVDQISASSGPRIAAKTLAAADHGDPRRAR